MVRFMRMIVVSVVVVVTMMVVVVWRAGRVAAPPAFQVALNRSASTKVHFISTSARLRTMMMAAVAVVMVVVIMTVMALVAATTKPVAAWRVVGVRWAVHFSWHADCRYLSLCHIQGLV